MESISLTSILLFFVVILFLVFHELKERLETVPIAIACLPILYFVVSKVFKELKFLKIEHLLISTAIFVFTILISLIFPISFGHFLFGIGSLTLAVLLSLLALYFNTETRIYWASLSIAFTHLYFYNLAFILKPEFVYLKNLPEIFLGLFASTLFSLLYEVSKKNLEVLSFEAMESEKKVLEELFETVDEMKEGFRLMNQTLRHDVLKKLQIISGYIEAYEMTKNPEFVEKSLKAVKECAEFIEKIGMLEKIITIEKSKLKPIRVEEIVKEVAKNYDIPINVKGSGVAIADESLSFVIDVILDNAIKHSGTDKVDVLLNEIENECEIRIIDYGVGIPDYVKKVIFKERFRSGETPGLGLGLYIVKKFVDRYGGKVWVEDTKPKGATFVIRLPSLLKP